MAKQQITLEEVLDLVVLARWPDGSCYVKDVLGTVWGDVLGTVWGDVEGNVVGNVFGTVGERIEGRRWVSVGPSINETPKERFQRLLKGTRNEELIDAFNKLKDTNDFDS